MFTRKDYMTGTIAHQEYYAQFVTPDVLLMVRSNIGEGAIHNSKDPFFNDIPLGRWDSLSTAMPANACRMVAESNLSTQAPGSKPSLSLSDRVCILKAAAQIIKDEASK